MGEVGRRPRRTRSPALTPMRRRSPTGLRAPPGSTFSQAFPATRSNTSVCLKVVDSKPYRRCRRTDRPHSPRVSQASSRKEKIAYDVGAYRDAPPGLRIWCGGDRRERRMSTALTALARCTPSLQRKLKLAQGGLTPERSPSPPQRRGRPFVSSWRRLSQGAPTALHPISSRP